MTEDELDAVTQPEESFIARQGTHVADDLFAFSFSSIFFFLNIRGHTLLSIEF